MKLPSLFVFLALLLAQTACLLPKPPGASVIKAHSLQKNSHGTFELIQMTSRDLRDYRSGRDPWSSQAQRPNKNLVFVAVDETVQNQFQQPLQEALNADQPVRLEEVSWWRFAPQFRGLYDEIIRISYDELTAQSLSWALDHMESKSKAFDVMLLTHGIPNHITASKGEGFISYKDLAQWGPYRHLNFVFMQGCYSETLAKDWIELGAKDTLSYQGLNRNFFYVDFFLPEYRKQGSVQAAYEKVNQNIKSEMGKSWLYGRILDELNMSLEEYFSVSPSPILDSVQ